MRRRSLLLAVCGCATLLALLVPPVAPAATGPVWELNSTSPTTAQPGTDFTYDILARNVGDAPVSAAGELIATLPAGMTRVSVETAGGMTCPGSPGDVVVTCTGGEGKTAYGTVITAKVTVAVPSLPLGSVPVARFQISGGAAPAETVDPVRIAAEPPGFGIDAFDALAAADSSGEASTQAAAHPYSAASSFDLNTTTNENPIIGSPYPVEPVRDVFVEAPPGMLGNASAFPTCTIADIANQGGPIQPLPACDPRSQVGNVLLRNDTDGNANVFGPFPLFNAEPPPDAPARFAFNLLGTVVVLDARVRSAGDYGVTFSSRQIAEGLMVIGTDTTLWGVPSSADHDRLRSCAELLIPSLGGPNCATPRTETAFLRNPSACTAPGEGLEYAIRSDSWFHPGEFHSSSFTTHKLPGYPHPPSEWGEEVGIDGCASVPFEPTISVAPTTHQADSPSGLDLHLDIPQQCWEAGEAATTCQSDLRDSEVKLPPEMDSNASATTGLGACSPAQVGLTTPVGQSSPIHFNEEPASCPDSSKIGTVDIETPLLKEHLTGGVYLAQQGNNPFNSLLAMYLVAEGSGVQIKQAGEIEADPQTGQLTTRFTEAPQLPFSDLHLVLFGGPRGALKTPASCGTYSAEAKLTPWARPTEPLTRESSFQITGCGAGGFDPHLDAGTENPLAGAFSPFNLEVSREDGSQELLALTAILPPGLVAKLAGIPYCPDSVLASISSAEGTARAEEEHPSCPAASQLGRVTIGAGPGPEPAYLESARAYLAGPYKGAPLSVAVVTPVVVGPFDLGSVVTRTALNVNPETLQTTAVSDPFPIFLYGLPVQLKDLRIELNRPSFTVNPTSCEPMQVGSQITSTTGATATPSVRYQAADCGRLAFKPKLTLSLKGKTARGAHPALSATLTMPNTGQANIARAQVTLPHAEFLDQGHIQNVCTHVQFEGSGCPASSILGSAKAWSPLLEAPLEGPVYLMSGFGHKLPDVAVDLNGQIRVLLHGKVDTGPGGGIRNTFEVVPDAPVTKFTLSLKGGRKGLIVNSEDLCAKPQRASVAFDGQNGKIRDSEPLLKTSCGHRGGHRHR